MLDEIERQTREAAKLGRKRAATLAKKPTNRRAPAKRHTSPRGNYHELLARDFTSRAKDPHRGLKALDRDRRSLYWNAERGTAAARAYLREHFPEVNPSDGARIAKALGLGAASFLASRIVGGMAQKYLPDKIAHHVPVISTAGLGLLAYFVTRKRPGLRDPILTGAGLALLDAIVKSYVAPHVPMLAGVLGCAEPLQRRELAAYEEPIGFLPPHVDAAGMGMEVHEAMADAGDGMGMEVHEAMADAGDGMGMEVHEAMADAGDGMGAQEQEAYAGYVPTDPGVGAYVPTGAGAYVPTNPGMGAYLPAEGMGAPWWQEAGAFMVGGPMGLAALKAGEGARRMVQRPGMVAAPPAMTTRPLLVRRVGQDGKHEYVVIHVHCPPYHHRHPHALPPRGAHGQFVRAGLPQLSPAVVAQIPTQARTIAAPPSVAAAASPVALSPQAAIMAAQAAGVPLAQVVAQASVPSAASPAMLPSQPHHGHHGHHRHHHRHVAAGLSGPPGGIFADND